MSRYKLTEEIKRRQALEKAVEKSAVLAYPSPSTLSWMLNKNGTLFSRQAVRNYYLSIGIVLDINSGLWIKRGNEDE